MIEERNSFSQSANRDHPSTGEENQDDDDDDDNVRDVA